MRHYVVKVMQLYLGPQILHTVIPTCVSFYRCSCYGKYVIKIRIVNSNLYKYFEKTLLYSLKSKFFELCQQISSLFICAKSEPLGHIDSKLSQWQCF